MLGRQLVGRLDRRDSAIQQEEERAQMDQMRQVERNPNPKPYTVHPTP